MTNFNSISMKRLFLLCLWSCAAMLASASVSLIAFQQNRDKAVFELVSVQRIDVNSNDQTMSVVFNNQASSYTGVRTIVFGEDVPTEASVVASGLQTYFIYPNPVHTTLVLKGVEEGLTYNVISFSGRVLLSGVTTADATEIDLSSLSSDTYLLCVNKVALRFIKQ